MKITLKYDENKYDEILQRLPQVKAHNCQNPYADIFPIAVAPFDFPTINYPDFELLDKEFILYVAPAGLYNSARKVELADLNDGVLIITNKRIAFNVDNDSFQCPISDVVAYEIVNEELVLIETNMITYTFMVNKAVTAIVRQMMETAKLWDDSEYDLFETREEEKKMIEPFKQSDYYQSLRREYEDLLNQK